MTDNDPKAVLIVDDDEIFRRTLSRAFASRGWETHAAEGLESGVALAREHAPELAVVDLRLGGSNGLDVVKALRDLDSTMRIIILTGYGSIATALESVRCGADHYLSKPVDVDQILAAYEAICNEASIAPSPSVPSLARVEWEHIQRVMTDCGGNVSQAAKLLGLHRRSLQRKLTKYPPAQ
jgi:two-component system response regulator RegA